MAPSSIPFSNSFILITPHDIRAPIIIAETSPIEERTRTYHIAKIDNNDRVLYWTDYEDRFLCPPAPALKWRAAPRRRNLALIQRDRYYVQSPPETRLRDSLEAMFSVRVEGSEDTKPLLEPLHAQAHVKLVGEERRVFVNYTISPRKASHLEPSGSRLDRKN